MSLDAGTFFDGLGHELTDTAFRLTKPSPTGRNVYGMDHRGIEITVNYVVNDTENRLSVKMTINRGSAGAPTPIYDTIAAEHRAESLDSLGRNVKWSPATKKTESKIEIERNLAQFHGDTTAMYAWVEEKAAVFKRWVDGLQ